MAQQPQISIPLDLPDVSVRATTVNQECALIIDVESTLTSTTCRCCGQTISVFYGYDRALLLRHLPILGTIVFWLSILSTHPPQALSLPVLRRSLFYDNHPTTTQRLSWYEANATCTNAFVRHLLLQLVQSTIADVVQKEAVTEDVVRGVVARWMETEVDWTTLPVFQVLGIDEIALKKGHRDFVAILTGRTATGETMVVAVLPDRLKETVVAWLRTIPPQRRAQITSVCTDIWEGYITALEEVLPHAKIVLDRFHVAKHYHDAADTC